MHPTQEPVSREQRRRRLQSLASPRAIGKLLLSQPGDKRQYGSREDASLGAAHPLVKEGADDEGYAKRAHALEQTAELGGRGDVLGALGR